MSFLTKGGKLVTEGGRLVTTTDPTKCPCCGGVPGVCCVNGACDPLAVTKEQCEECVQKVICMGFQPPDGDGKCPDGWTFDAGGGFCFRARETTGCEDCRPAAPDYESCEPQPAQGPCGVWVEGVSNCAEVPPKCWPTACVSGLPAIWYGGPFRIGGYITLGLPDPPDGYRGPPDPTGDFLIYPQCGAWFIDSVRNDQTGTYFIKQHIGGGCLEKKQVKVRIFKDRPPNNPNAIFWQTATIDITPGECSAAREDNPLP
jgi:hypothetical protein